MNSSERQAHADKLNARLAQYQADIAKLEAGLDEMDADARIEHEKRVRKLQSAYGQVKSELDNILSQTEEYWQEMKAGLDQAWAALEDDIREAADWLDGTQRQPRAKPS